MTRKHAASEVLAEDPTARPPERRWTASYGPARRGRPSVVKAVAFMPGGWPMEGNEARYRTHKVCASIVARTLNGDRSECPDPTVWRVRETRRGLMRTAYYCDHHLPDGDRPPATLSDLADGDASNPAR